jgi:catechol 2,3-dioxygenase-like lactoylglutathione lyase family enzyme
VSGQLLGLHHVQLAAPPGSEQALRHFYGTVLGMTEVAKPPVLAARGGAWFRSGALELHLGIEDGFRPAHKAHPGIIVSDIDAVVKRLGDPVSPRSGTTTFRASVAATSPIRMATASNSSSRSPD